MTAKRGSPRAEEIRDRPALPPGRYLVKISIDQTGKLAKDFRAELGPDELIGQVEVESDWPAGYGKMTVVPFPASAKSPSG